MLGIHQRFVNPMSSIISDACGIGANTVQFFNRNNRNNKQRYISKEEIDYFNSSLLRSNIESFVIHASYIMNPATDSEILHDKTVGIIRSDLCFMKRLAGIKYYVLHPGSATDCTQDAGIQNLVKTLLEVKPYIGNTVICLEVMAGAGNQLLYNEKQCLSVIALCRMQGLNNIFLCYDTCHAFAAGMNLRQSFRMLRQYTKVVHLNNSKFIARSFKDRHSSITNGHIDVNSLLDLAMSCDKDTPIILETPMESLIDDFLFVKQNLHL